MTFANLSEIFEPVNHTRKIIGFDTFTGFPSLSKQDSLNKAGESKVGGLYSGSYETLLKSIELFNRTRFLKHIEKVELVKGDVLKTLPGYLKDNPQLVVSLLWLDFDIYEPTRFVLEKLIDRIPKGGVIAFDELNHEVWKGETIAVKEVLGIHNLRVKRFPFGGTLSYAVIGE
ncbi:MAG: TylF/MycF family methyltransferase [Ignavibacteriales bacterium]|nr:TylF/MycF family methyltransferase [Ignavibacteriales bacterium]